MALELGHQLSPGLPYHWPTLTIWGSPVYVIVWTYSLWPPDAKIWLIWKDPDAGKDWGQEEKGKTEDEMVGWHHWLNGHGFGWPQGVGDGQGDLACCGSWGHKESDMTEQLNWFLIIYLSICLSICLSIYPSIHPAI